MQRSNVPEVTVVIPAYNCELYIDYAVKSVMAQTESNIEILVVDDGSTDNTQAILVSLASKDARIKTYKQINSGKPSIARNTGLKEAKGKFICFLDGDDLYHPRKIEKSLEVLKNHPEIDVVFHDVKILASDGTEVDGTYLKNVGFRQKAYDYLEDIGRRVYITYPEFYNFMSTTITGIHTSSIMIRKERLDLENTWFPEDMPIGEDIDLWFRLVKGSRVGYIDRPLSYYRLHNCNMTKNIEALFIGSIDAHTKNFYRAFDVLNKREKSSYRNRISYQYSYLGYHYFINGKPGMARNSYLQAMKWFFVVKHLMPYFKTFFPDRVILLYRKFKLLS